VLYEIGRLVRPNPTVSCWFRTCALTAANKISIDPKAWSQRRDRTTEEVVAPADRSRRSGQLQDQTHVHAGGGGDLVGASGKPLSVGSKGKLDGGDTDFVVGYDGRIFLKDSGCQQRHGEPGEGECHASFDYAAAEDRQVTVGPVFHACEATMMVVGRSPVCCASASCGGPTGLGGRAATFLSRISSSAASNLAANTSFTTTAT